MGFIASNAWAATHKEQYSPIGFDIIYPGMVNYAKELGLALPLSPSFVDSFLHTRHSDFRFVTFLVRDSSFLLFRKMLAILLLTERCLA